MIKVIALDLDNCIVLNPCTGEGSEEIRDLAWFKVFPYPDFNPHALGRLIEQAKVSILEGGGGCEDIVAYVLESYGLPKEYMLKNIALRCEQFDRVVQEEVQKIGISLDVKSALQALSKKVPLYVNAATRRASVVKILEALALTCFKGVYGRPGTKITNLQRIATMEGVALNRMLFVGDMPSDYAAARVVGCKFAGVRTRRNAEWRLPQGFPMLGSVAELENLLSEQGIWQQQEE